MPQAVVAVKAFLALSTAAKLAAIGTFVLKTALVAAVSYGLARLVAKKPGAMRSAALTQSSVLDMTIEPDTPRRVIYGELRVGGSLRLKHIAGSSNEYIYLILVLAGHQCAGIGDIYFADEVVPLDESGNATGTYAGTCRITKHLGAPDQSADANFVAELGSVWTSDHRLRGCAYLAIRLTWNQDKYPGGLPVITAIVQGKNNIYDPRDASTGWSDNPSLCIRDYLLDQQVGMQGSTDDLVESSFVTAANDCDTMAALAAGGEEKLYTLNGAFDTSVVPSQVIEAMCDAMAGDIYDVGGQAYICAGVWHTPDFDLTEEMLRGGMTTTSPLSVREKFNGAKGTFNDPEELWNRTDFPAYAPAGLLSEDNGRERMADLDLPFVNTASRCQRIAKIAVQLTRHGTLASIPCNLRAIPAMPGKNIRVTNTKRSWSNKHFKVREFSLSTDRGSDGGVGFVVDIVAQATASAIYDWSHTEEAAYVPSPEMGYYDPHVVPTPGGLTLSTEYFAQPDGTLVPRLKVVWNAAGNVFVVSGGRVHIEYKKTADSDWLVWTSSLRGNATLDYITDVLAGVSYDVRLAFENSQGVKGAYSATADHTVSTDAVATAAPGSLSATAAPGSVNLAWAEVADTRLAYYRVYRRPASETDDIAGATLVWAGRATSWTDFLVTQGVTYRYWVRAITHTGIASSASSPATAAPNPSTGNFIDYRFKRATTAPDTPTGDNPSGWSDSPPTTPADQPLWLSKAQKTSTGTLVGAWSAPIQLTGEDGQDGAAGADGEDGDSLEVQYSVNGSSDWHFPFESGDLYMRQRLTGGDWSIAIRIVGEAGAPGNAYSITINFHPSGGGSINGVSKGGGTQSETGLAAGGVYEIAADATVGGESFQYWQAAWPDGELIQVETSNITSVLLTKNLTLTAYYL
jgi:hypothetical protein